MKYSLFLIALLVSMIGVFAEKSNVTEVPVSAEVTNAYSLTLGSYNVKVSLPSLGNFTGPLIGVGIVLAGLLVYLLVRKVFF
ncbi:MAG: hypothetical protein AABX39_01880 [Nanoarchaeota archaeon]